MAIKFKKKPLPEEAVPFEDSQPAKDSAEVVAEQKAAKKATKKAAKKVAKKVRPKADAEPSTTEPDAAKVTGVQPTATTTIKHKTGVEEVQQEPVGPVLMKVDPMANIGLSLSMTKNLGNFNNVKYGVTLHMPSGTSPEELEETFQRVEAWVDGKMQKITEELLEGED